MNIKFDEVTTLASMYVAGVPPNSKPDTYIPGPPLLTIPDEMKRMIVKHAITTEIVVCAPKRAPGTDQSCTSPERHNTPVKNPNLNLLLICREIGKVAKPLIPDRVNVRYSQEFCAIQHLEVECTETQQHVNRVIFDEFVKNPTWTKAECLKLKGQSEAYCREIFDWAPKAYAETTWVNLKGLSKTKYFYFTTTISTQEIKSATKTTKKMRKKKNRTVKKAVNVGKGKRNEGEKKVIVEGKYKRAKKPRGRKCRAARASFMVD